MELRIYKSNDFSPELIGVLADDGSFTYAEAYLSGPAPRAVSFSLPLRSESYPEELASPYFKGLLPEGEALAKLAHLTGYRPTDYLRLLATCGLDCVGDIVINPEAFERASYEPVELEDETPYHLAFHNAEIAGIPMRHYIDGTSRLSLAGTQDKVGLLFCDEGTDDGGIRRLWYKPLGGAPSNAIVKYPNDELPELMVNEHLCMEAARGCGLNCAKTELIHFGRGALAVERFDRAEYGSKVISGLRAPLRRHQEDFGQIFGRLPNSGDKYAELEGGTIRAIAQFLQNESAAPALDVRELARVCLFNYAIGNCDNHLKNLSVLYAPDWSTVRLAPVYDLVSTTFYARFSTTMGMRIGRTREIGEVSAEDLRLMADDLGVTEGFLRKTAGEIADRLHPALGQAAKRLDEQEFDLAYYISDNIEEEISPRIEVLKAFSRGA